MSGIYSANYYPLSPTKGTYRQPETFYLDVRTNEAGDFLTSTILDDNGLLLALDTAPELMEFIRALPSQSWVICYDLDFIPTIWEAALNSFRSIEGLGEYNSLIYLIYDKIIIYLVDAFQFFLDPLPIVIEKMGWVPQVRGYPPLRDIRKLREYSLGRSLQIKSLWESFREALRVLYGVHPSKSPGATAIKTWRTTLKQPVKARGNVFRKFTRASITAPALYWQNGYYPKVYHYDINGSYINIMRSMPYPVRFLGFADREPPSNRWIGLVRLDYKTARKFSPLTVKIEDGSIVHPTEARGLRTMLTYIDAMTLSMAGELKITEWLEGIYWGPDDEDHIFQEWAQRLEDTIIQTPEQKTLLKVFSRALHSKFAQSPKLEIIELKRVRPLDVFRLRVRNMYPLSDGGLAAQIVTNKKAPFRPYLRPDWEALTLAMGRLIIHSAIDLNTVYVDTDSIISITPREDLPEGPHFGEWKLSGEGPAYIAGPRMYIVDNKPKSSGVRPQSRQDLINGLIEATKGRQTVITAIERAGLLDPTGAQIYRDHNLRLISFPKARVIGSRVWVRRSPETLHKIPLARRIIT